MTPSSESPLSLRGMRALVRPLLHTPLHPQWLATLGPVPLHGWLARQHGSRILDVGCAGQDLRTCVPGDSHYIGIDHPGTSVPYASRPAVYADGHRLPFASGSIDAVLLVNVLEHLSDPERAIVEMARVLRPGGRLLLEAPFLYPLHDSPNDFTRWTEAGLRALLARRGFTVAESYGRGRPLETAALLFNLSLAHSFVFALRRRSLAAALMAPLVPVLVLAANLAGWLASRLLGPNPLMPRGYQVLCIKSAG